MRFIYFSLLALFIVTPICVQSQVVYSTPGTYTWIVPACVNSITVKTWGAGGGGGGTASRQTNTDEEACTQGGGGGGGGFAMQTYAVIPGESYTLIVGAGGIGGVGANNSAVPGGNGGNSSFSGPATISLGTLSANGGAGGQGATAYNNNNGYHIGSNGIGGNGGTGINGATMYSGGNGSEGSHSASCVDISGAGGGGAGTNGNGANAQQIGGCPHTAAMTGGSGGSQSGGNGANGVKNNIVSKHNLNGNDGLPYGGGGSGAGIHLNSWANQWVLANGGKGANGAIIIEFTVNGILPNQPTIDGLTTLPCNTTTGTYTIPNPVTGETYTWSYTGNATPTSGTGTTFDLTNITSSGTITVTPSNACGNGPATSINIVLENTTFVLNPIQGNTLIPCGTSSGTYQVNALPGVTYTWTFSGTGTISGTGNSITLTASTNGTLSVQAVDNCGNTQTQTLNIQLDATNAIQPTIVGLTTLPCNTTSGTYAIANPITGETYTWSYTGNATPTSGTGTTFDLTNITSSGTLTVIPSNACGNGPATSINIDLENTTFVLDPIQGNTLIPCGTSSGSYQVNALPGVTYTWTFAGTGTISGTGNSITLTASTNGTLSVQAVDHCGNTQTQTLTIQLDAPNAIQPAFNLAQKACENTAIIPLVGTPAGGQFTVNNIPATTIDPNNLPLGTYNVNYTVTENGCSLSASKSITIYPNPTLSSNLETFYCFNHADVILNFQPSNGNLSGDFLSGNLLQLSQATSGQHSITYTYNDTNNCSATLTQQYTLGNPIEFTIAYQQDCLNEIHFTNTAAENYTYNWNFQSFGTSTQKDPTLQLPALGNYPYSVTVTDATGCTFIAQDNIQLTETVDLNILNIPNVITPNNDDVNDHFSLDPSIFNCIDLKITLLNRWGNIIYVLDETNVTFEGISNNKSELAEGVYFYSVHSEKLQCKNGIGNGNCNGFITIIR